MPEWEPGKRYEVALSFADPDRPYVRRVAEALQSRNRRVFYDEFEQVRLWGKDLFQHLNQLYRTQAIYCVVFVSEHYIRKVWTQHELKAIQAGAFEMDREFLLPARFDDSQLPGQNPTVGYLDLRALEPESLADMLDRKLRQLT